MISKGNQRGGGTELATHLLNEFENEYVEIAEVRGAVAQDLHGAFSEWKAHAKPTRCVEYLYSLSVNPDPAQAPLRRDQFLDFIERTEKRLGLVEQPRVVVFQKKHGREHCHVVWSRIDLAKMKAVPLPRDRMALRAVAREFARDHGITLPEGLRRDRGHDRFRDRNRQLSLAEKQQEERSGLTLADRMATIGHAWTNTKDSHDFVRALAASGYTLARGDRRDYVVVDRAGEVHSLSRQLKGVAKAAAIRGRLAKDYPPDKMLSAAQAQEKVKGHEQSLREQQKRAAGTVAAATVRQALADAHHRRRVVLDERKAALDRQHTVEREGLEKLQQEHARGISAFRLAGRPKGLWGFLARVTGIQAYVASRERRQDTQRQQENALQLAALKRKHEREQKDMARHYRSLRHVENRERRALATALRRQEFEHKSGRVAPSHSAETREETLAERFERLARQMGNSDLTRSFNSALGSSAGDVTRPDSRLSLSDRFNELNADRKSGREVDRERERTRDRPPGPANDR